MAGPWYWDISVHNFRDEGGRFMSQKHALDLARRSIEIAERPVGYLAQSVSDGRLSPKVWETLMREQTKDAYIREYVLGIGGRDQMTYADWGRVGRALRDQYDFLGQFKGELPNLSQAQIEARAAMYPKASREAFEMAKYQNNKEMELVKWQLSDVKHCETCWGFAEQGWVPNDENAFGGAYPGDGSTICLSNCACSLEYQMGEPE